MSTELDERSLPAGADHGLVSLTVVIADEDESRRRMVRHLLESAVQIAGEASDDRGALELVQEHRPDVALVGFGLPQVGGLEVVRRIKSQWPETQVVLVTSHEEAYLSATGKSGADALLPWRELRDHLLGTIRALTRRHVALWDGTERRGRWPRSRTAPWDGRERRRNRPEEEDLSHEQENLPVDLGGAVGRGPRAASHGRGRARPSGRRSRLPDRS